jgi:secreted trypsin-like serine protease
LRFVQGDSGGPLNCPDGNGSYHVCGITSWGVSNKDTKTGNNICVVALPSVYTRVTSYLDWINSIMAEHP